MSLSAPPETGTGARLRRYRRRLLAAAVIGLIAGLLAILPQSREFELRGIDFLLPLRHLVFGPLFPPSKSDVVVVAIDEQTYRTDPFSNTPKVAWTPYYGYVIDAVDAAGPKAIGLDTILPTTLDRPELLLGYDRPFLLSLRKAAMQNHLVMGETKLSGQMLAPYPGQVLAANGQDNVRMLNMPMEKDDVVRRYLAGYATQEGGHIPSFAVDLAQRAGAKPPKGDFIINYNTGPGDVPIYSMADLYACASQGKTDYFKKAFAGKVVLLAETLDIEDRFRGAKRLDWNEGASARAAPARCAVAADPNSFATNLDRKSMPGVLIQAAAINTLTKNLALTQLGVPATFLLVGLATFGLAAAFLALGPVSGALVGVTALALEGAASVAALQAKTVAPAASLLVTAILAYTLIYAYRFVIEDREKRWVQHAFRHYLAPALVDQLMDRPEALKLGGDQRLITVMFTDIAGFTTISEGLKETPGKLVELMNRYLTMMTGPIGARDGYIDKFIGDAVMAVWGAPLAVADAERKAVDAALDCRKALADFNRDVTPEYLPSGQLGTRFGIATGIAIAGNMGSEDRLNYTVTGDTVNLAARLEGANKEYGTTLMISETTAAALPKAENGGDGYVLRRLDRLIVKGKTEPIVVFEVLGRAGEVGAEDRARVTAFEAALAKHDARDFKGALAGFEAQAGTDPPSKVYAERCKGYLEAPPPAGWQGEFALKTK
ncbi:MAG: adenylate/guanylate cyclase domain-containing protein [Proteobacteria bacterium]|nr:adenylate/guanylate cyclase domain-containing protein [Pseudomonadota bacterium]